MSPLGMHRRFGRGAARLPLGTPAEAVPLAHAARTRVAGERVGALAPGGAFALLFLLVGMLALQTPTGDVPLTDPTRIVALDWDVVPVTEAPTPKPTPVERAPVVESAPLLAQDPVVEIAEQPSGPPTPSPTPRFDPRSLVSTGRPTAPDFEPAARDIPPATARRPSALPTARSLTDLAIAVPRSAHTGLAKEVAPIDSTGVPRTRPEAPRASSEAPSATWNAMGERTEFLAALTADASAPRAAPDVPRALPPVAAPSNDAARAVREAALARLSAEGWDAVPLESLPDCQPAGRQDALKRRILRTAADRPRCVHAEGAYRFLETRNLNAFLMGSRSHTASAAIPAARDACEVLERALRCLEGTVSKELEAR